jgi:hypothetical protein
VAGDLSALLDFIEDGGDPVQIGLIEQAYGVVHP